MAKRTKMPTDVNQRAASIVALATSDEIPRDSRTPPKNAAAVALGRLGGRKGGKARADAMTPAERSEIARRAARARWDKASESDDR